MPRVPWGFDTACCTGPCGTGGVSGAAFCQNIEERPPPFRVPPDINVFEEDSDRSRFAVQSFTDTLASGVSLRLFMEGCGALEVKATLDCKCSILQLAFNSVRKSVPLRLVRSVSLQEAPDGCHVVLELDGDLFCTFVFSPDERGAHEASFFGGCIQILVEAARFEAVKVELASLGAVVPIAGLPHDFAQDRECATLPTSRSMCSLPENAVANIGGGKTCVLEGASAAAVITALALVEEDAGQMQRRR